VRCPILPFLKPKKLAATIIAHRKSDGTRAPDQHEGEEKPELMGMAEKLIGAVHSKDAKSVAEVVREMHGHLAPKSDKEKEEKA